MLISRRIFLGLTSAGTLALALPAWAFSSARAQDVSNTAARKVVENGVAQAVIVTAAAPSAVATYAAAELQAHIGKATGARLEIVIEENAGGAKNWRERRHACAERVSLQEEGKKQDPEATVIGYAYADYSAPPVETKLNKNIIVGIVPSYSFPLDEKDKENFHAAWNGWAKTGARLYLRPNYFLSGYDMPYNFAEQFGEEFKFASQRGMIATDFDSPLGMWGVQGINLYMTGRLNAHPNLSVAEVLDEYYAGFGGAQNAARRYFDYWKTITNKADNTFRTKSQGGWGFVSKDGDQIYTPQTFEVGHAILGEAKTAAAGDAEVSQRVEFLGLWLEHARLSMAALAAFHAQRDNPRDAKLKGDFAAAKLAVDEFRAAHADDIVNISILRQLEVWAGWRKTAELVK